MLVPPPGPRWSHGRNPNLLLIPPCPMEAAVLGLMRRSRAADLLAVSERTVRRWGAARVLEERHIGPRAGRVTEASVFALMTEPADHRNQDREADAA